MFIHLLIYFGSLSFMSGCSFEIHVVIQFYPWCNFISLCFKLITIHYHTSEQREIKFKLTIKLNHNIHKGEGVRMYEIYFFIHVYTIIYISCLFLYIFFRFHSIKKSIQPTRDIQYRTDIGLTVWIVEAKGLTDKSKRR